ncbi:MAG: PACE efflux transporter [Herminiimonas sp.]|nr:PACE efflux transporter [Herminiimonas sp.]
MARLSSRVAVISTLQRRLVHAVLFEVGALVLLVPLMSWGLGMDLLHLGSLALVLSLCAMGCNMGYNHLFEWLESRYRWKRTLVVRVGHTLGFELSFLAVALPITAWWLSMTIIEAFLLDLAFTIFFLVYAFVYNWVYDIVRARMTT